MTRQSVLSLALLLSSPLPSVRSVVIALSSLRCSCRFLHTAHFLPRRAATRPTPASVFSSSPPSRSVPSVVSSLFPFDVRVVFRLLARDSSLEIHNVRRYTITIAASLFFTPRSWPGELSMQKSYRVANGKLIEVPEPESTVTVFVNPTEAERRHCLEDLKIDEHTFHSALDPDELSRIEFEPDHVAVIYSRPRIRTSQDQFEFRGGSVGAFVFADRLVLVAADDVPLFDSVPLARVNTNLTLLLKLVLGAVVHFRDHLKSISMISDDLQKEINTAMENRHLIYLFTLEKSLVYYLNFIHSNNSLLERLRNNAARIGFAKEELEILDDILIENSQCMKQAEIFSNIIASLMDARASIVGNNLNVIMRKLMLITIAIMTPSLVVALFSMNVALPMQKWGGAFYFIVGAAVASAVAVVRFWGRRRT